jgi:DNA repair protein RecO (recombination protein O)
VSDRRARGFVLNRRPFREHDLRAELLLEDGDRVDVLAPSGQRSQKRFAAGLTPMALYRFGLTTTPKGTRLDDALIDRSFPALHNHLTRQTVALTATSFVRETTRATPGDGTLFLLLGEVFVGVAEDTTDEHTAGRLVRMVFDVLRHQGCAPVLDRCVRCENVCPDHALVTLDLSTGAVVCRACGGGSYRLTAQDRASLRAVVAGDFTRYGRTMLRTVSRIVSGVSPEGSQVLERADAVISRE